MKKIIHCAFWVVGLAMLMALGGPSGLAQSPIVNSVHVGGPDLEDPDFPFDSGPGVDKNFSLAAFKYADGTAGGRFTDRWGPGIGLQGTTVFRASIDCAHVVGNNAWVSGVVNQGLYIGETGEIDITGWYVSARVQDNGNNNNPSNRDRIGLSIFNDTEPFDCTQMWDDELFDMPRGQVRVR